MARCVRDRSRRDRHGDRLACEQSEGRRADGGSVRRNHCAGIIDAALAALVRWQTMGARERRGGFSIVDLATGKLTTVASLPGFTRGLDFLGPLAFIGLSQVRETAVFSGIPITERLKPEERACGVWIVDIRNGQTVAFLRFESGVQEIFAVQVLPFRFPELLPDDHDLVASSYVLPDAAMPDVRPAPADPNAPAKTE